MQEAIRRTLLNTTVIDVEAKENTTIFYLKNQHGAFYSIEFRAERPVPIF